MSLLYDSRQEVADRSHPIYIPDQHQQLGRWLGYGNVAIRTYIGTILFRDVTNPEQVMALMQEQQARAQIQPAAGRDPTRIEKTIGGKIGPHPASAASAQSRPAQPKSQPMQHFLSDLLHLRYETGGHDPLPHALVYPAKKNLGPILAALSVLSRCDRRLANRFSILSLLATCGLVFFRGILYLPAGGYTSTWTGITTST